MVDKKFADKLIKDKRKEEKCVEHQEENKGNIWFVVAVVAILVILGNPSWSGIKSNVIHALPLTRNEVVDFYDVRYSEDGNIKWLEEKQLALTAWENDTKLPRSKREYIAVSHDEYYNSIPPMVTLNPAPRN